MVDNGRSNATKRHRKRKTKAQRKHNAAKKEEERQRSIEDAKMNSHSRLRNALVVEGFTLNQIDNAMEEMWNNKLAYDEFDAVLLYMKTGGKTIESISPVEITETGNKQRTNGIHVVGTSTMKAQKVEATSIQQQLEQSTASMTMASKLEMVATFENLSDAIFAMTEWIIKAAKPHELEELCVAVKTPALLSIIRRAISECQDQSNFDTNVLPGMVRLLDSLLRKCGMTTENIITNQEAFRSILSQTRRICFNKPIESQGIADRVSRFVVSRILVALNESKVAYSGNNTSPQSKYMSLMNSTLKSDQEIGELLSKREMNKISAKRFHILARSACKSSGNVEDVNDRSNSVEGDAAKAEILSAIVNDDGKNITEQHTLGCEKLKAQVKEDQSEKVAELKDKIESLQNERELITNQIVKLRQSIETLEARGAAILIQQTTLQDEIEAESKTDPEGANRLNIESKNIKSDESILTLVDMLKTFDDSLVVRSVEVVSQAENVEENASRTMDLHLLSAQNYFIADLKCYQFLQSRIVSSQKTISELKLEISECQGLGMTITIEQMEATVKVNKELVARYTELLSKIEGESTSIFDAMMEHLEQYKAAHEASELSLLRIRTTSIQRILDCVTQMKVPNSDRLDIFYADSAIFGSQIPLSSKDSSMPLPAATPTMAETTSNAARMPKLTWANGKKLTRNVGKPSFLDIQEEEFQKARPFRMS